MKTDKINITRELLYILAKNSQWRKQSIQETLTETHIRPRPADWLHFLNYIFLALGGMLFVSGLFFFFAYNWDEMPKMVKLGITQSPIVGLGIYLIFKKTDNLIGKIVLTFLSCFIGLAFAVYGQIYQTGATAFDFLWGWTLLAFIWVIISDFPPLWFLYLALINLTMMTYLDQFYEGIEMIPTSFIFLGINLLAIVLFEVLNYFKPEHNPYRWFPQLVTAFVIGILSINISVLIFDAPKEGANLMLLTAFVLFPLTFYYYYHYKKEIAMVGLIPFAVICLGAIFLTKVLGGNDFMVFLLVGVFVVVCSAFLISFLTKYKKHLNELSQ